MIARALDLLGRRAAPVLAVALFIGIALPDLAHRMKPLLSPAVITLLAAAVVRIDPAEVLRHLRRPGPAILGLLWLMVLAPVAMWAAVSVIEPPGLLGTALVLMASSPTLVSMPAFAFLLGLDAALALVILVASSLLLPLIQPPLALLLLGLDLQVSLGALMARLGLFVGGAFAVGVALRYVAGADRIERASGPIAGISVLALVIFAIGVMDGMTATILARPGHVALFVGAAFLGNFALQLVGGLAFAWLDRRRGLTIGLAGGNRNLAILVAVLGSSADPDLFLYLACGQFPLYLVPALLGPLYRRLVAGRGAPISG